MRQKAWMKLADRAGRTMSQARAMLAPAPAATPLTAHTTGFSKRRRRRTSGLYQVSSALPPSTLPPAAMTAARSARSCPAQKPRPAPVSSTARIVASPSTASNAAASARCSSVVKALSLSGRLSVIVATPSARSHRRLSPTAASLPVTVPARLGDGRRLVKACSGPSLRWRHRFGARRDQPVILDAAMRRGVEDRSLVEACVLDVDRRGDELVTDRLGEGDDLARWRDDEGA